MRNWWVQSWNSRSVWSALLAFKRDRRHIVVINVRSLYASIAKIDYMNGARKSIKNKIYKELAEAD